MTAQQQYAFEKEKAGAMVERQALAEILPAIEQAHMAGKANEMMDFALPGQAPVKMTVEQALQHANMRLVAIDNVYLKDRAKKKPAAAAPGKVVRPAPQVAPVGGAATPAVVNPEQAPRTSLSHKIPKPWQEKIANKLAELHAKGRLYSAHELAKAAKLGDVAAVAGYLDGAGFVDLERLGASAREKKRRKKDEDAGFVGLPVGDWVDL
jgi:hypothetical protein